MTRWPRAPPRRGPLAHRSGGAGDDPAAAEQPLDQRVEATLAALARHALLVG